MNKTLRKSARANITKILLKWGTENYRDFPWRNTNSPWLGLLAEILLQRTNAAHVEQVWEEIVALFPTPESVLETKESNLKVLNERFGLSRRHKTILELAYFLDSKDWYPIQYDELLSLYGVGHYTASAYLSLHMNVRAVLVDANIARWLSRFIGREKPKDIRRSEWLWKLADDLTPDSKVKEYNYAVLDFTMSVCKSRQPQCCDCPLQANCRYHKTLKTHVKNTQRRQQD